MWIDADSGEFYRGDRRFGSTDFHPPGEPPARVTHAILDEFGAFVAWAEPPDPEWQPDPVWQEFISGVAGNPHANPYSRINGLANGSLPQLNTALIRLALAWREQGDRDFWRTRVGAALANIEAILGAEHKISAHPAEVALFESWNTEYGLGLVFPWA